MSAYKGGMDYSADTDAAQAFLSNKLSKNKYNSSEDYSTEGFDPSSYTAEQMSNLTAFGGPKKFGKKSYEVVTNQGEIDAANEFNSNAAGQGKLTAEQIRDKFGFEYNEGHASKGGGYDSEHGGRDDGAIFNLSNGEYIGSVPGFKPRVSKSGEDDPAQGIDPFKAVQDYEVEQGFLDTARDDWDSMNDVSGSVNNVIGEAEELKEVPEAIMGEDPVEHSPEIQQAKERVGKYENDVLSGKTSQTIYGGADKFYDGYNLNLIPGSPSSDPSSNYQFNTQAPQLGNKYEFNAGNTNFTSGFNGSDISPAATPPKKQQATASFLDNQKKKVIKEKNIQPVNWKSYRNYGKLR